MASFQEKIYRVVRKIPRGQVLSYKEVAERAGHPLAWRAAGNVLHNNYHPDVPCHRVVRADGRVGGFRGGGQKKTALLRKEGVLIDSKGRILGSMKF